MSLLNKLKKDDGGFVFRSGPSIKQEKSFSSFWGNNDDTRAVDELLGIDEEKKKGKDIIALAGYKRAISNFVTIVTGKHIPVTFKSGNDSYTDGNSVVIGANLTDNNFDVAVGLALHEGSHIKLSNFNFLKNLEMNIPEEVYISAETKNISRNNVTLTVKNLLNYVEDRRIDNFVFTTSPGYRGYYHSMYNKYWYSDIVDKGILSSDARTEEIESYMFRIINLHNKNRQLNALKGLKEIYSLIDLRNISRLDSSEDAFDVAIKVMNVILNSIDKVKVDENSDESSDENKSYMPGDGDEESGEGSGSGSGSGSGGTDGEGNDNTLSDEQFDDLLDRVENNNLGENGDGGGKSVEVPNDDGGNWNQNDDGTDSVILSDRQRGLLKKAIEKQEKFLDGDVKKTKLSKKDNTSIKAIGESGASYEQVGDGISNNWYDNGSGKGTKCLVVRKLTQNLIDSGMFECATSWNQQSYNSSSIYKRYDFVEEGLRLGTVLGRKLKVRGEETTIKYSRKNAGKIDKRIIAELGFDNESIFSQSLVTKFNKAYLHISVDASGSMCGDKWNKAMTSAVAMIKACDMAGNIDVVVSIRSTHNGDCRGHYSVPLIMVCYDSRIDKLSKIRKLFSSLDVGGTTPEGLCFEAIEKDFIPGNSNQDSYFINYSDGQPIYNNSEIYYTGETAIKHTAKMVSDMRAKGMNVLSYFIGSDRYDDDMDSFKKMYGNDASFINATNMMEVAKTMNDKFLQK